MTNNELDASIPYSNLNPDFMRRSWGDWYSDESSDESDESSESEWDDCECEDCYSDDCDCDEGCNCKPDSKRVLGCKWRRIVKRFKRSLQTPPTVQKNCKHGTHGKYSECPCKKRLVAPVVVEQETSKRDCGPECKCEFREYMAFMSRTPVVKCACDSDDCRCGFVAYNVSRTPLEEERAPVTPLEESQTLEESKPTFEEEDEDPIGVPAEKRASGMSEFQEYMAFMSRTPVLKEDCACDSEEERAPLVVTPLEEDPQVPVALTEEENSARRELQAYMALMSRKLAEEEGDCDSDDYKFDSEGNSKK